MLATRFTKLVGCSVPIQYKGVTGAIEAMPHWAGESVDGVKTVQPAAEIVRELVDEAEQLLRRWG
jgi:hypothetical protein